MCMEWYDYFKRIITFILRNTDLNQLNLFGDTVIYDYESFFKAFFYIDLNNCE